MSVTPAVKVWFTAVSGLSIAVIFYAVVTRVFGDLVPVNVGDVIMPGTAVHVTGNKPSKVPGDLHIVFARDGGGEPVINSFTVYDAFLLADFDLDSTFGTQGNGGIPRNLPPNRDTWLIPVSPGRPHVAELVDFVKLDGIKVLSLAGDFGAVRVWGAQGIAQEPLLEPGQSVTNPPAGTLWVEAIGPGFATLTFTFTGTGVASNYACSANLDIMACDHDHEPITTETVPMPGGAIVNPACIKLGGMARYVVDVLPPGFPDTNIVWSITEGMGRVRFYNGRDKGRSVIVEGRAEGGFKLETRVIGNTEVHPVLSTSHIYGMVEDEVLNPIHFIVITSNNVPAVSIAQLDAWVANANHNGRQIAMSFTRASVTYLERPECFTMPSDEDSLKNLFSYTNNVGGIKVYCVNRFDNPAVCGKASFHLPIKPTDGIAVAADAPPITLIHEILHTCGLKDIYLDNIGEAIVSEGLLGTANWSGGEGTGHYPPGLKHKDLIKRLMMYGHQDGYEADIPFADLEWPREVTVSGGSVSTNRIPVSRVSIQDRTPRH